MDILQFIKSRRSIRKFTDSKVEASQINTVLEAGRWAPSAGNCQPWRFLVVTNRRKIKKFDPFFHQPWVEKAPVIIVILASPEDTHRRYGPGSTWYVQDCSAAAQNMLLMAHGLGMGAVWVGAFSKEAVRDVMDIDSHLEVFGLICLGHYDNKGKTKIEGQEIANDERRRRKSLEKIAFAESLESPWKI